MSDAPMSVDVAAAVTRELLDHHGLTGWAVRFDNRRRIAGTCNYVTRTITLSRFIMARMPAATTRNTITHEVAHALTKGHGHGHVWQAMHLALGGDGKRCQAVEPVDDTAPWIAVCAKGVQHHRYRAPKPGSRYRCRCAPYGPPFVFVPNPARSNAR